MEHKGLTWSYKGTFLKRNFKRRDEEHIRKKWDTEGLKDCLEKEEKNAKLVYLIVVKIMDCYF